jgi:hypothetical protein
MLTSPVLNVTVPACPANANCELNRVNAAIAAFRKNEFFIIIYAPYKTVANN